MNVRRKEVLDGLWEFQFLGCISLDYFSPPRDGRYEKLWVPSAFDALPELSGKRGAAVYKMRFKLPAGARGRLEFGAVSMWCRVFVDDELLTENRCGYAPFCVDIPISSLEERELIVLVDNRYDFERVPMHEEYFDFYQYGGIIRSVELSILPNTENVIDTVQVLPKEGYRDGEVELRVYFTRNVDSPQTLHLQFDGKETLVVEAINPNGGIVTLTTRIPAPKIWSPEEPNLHTLVVGIPGADAISVRFGLRKIEARDGNLWLNDEVLKLRGYNRHEWHPNTGPSTSSLQMYADLQLMRDLGCNFIRGCHYPQDQRFLSLCDELGFLVWEENLGWGQRERTLVNERFLADHDKSLRAMVRASGNHPSVIIWGFLNEAGSNQEYARNCFESTVRTLRALDPSRLISYATMFPFDDKYYELVDVISINNYPGWYSAEGVENPLDLIEPFWNKCFQAIDKLGFCDKPIMISETGVEGLYGWHDSHDDFFTEEFQAKYLKRACAWALNNPRCCGIALWHFSDVRTYSGGWSLKRPRTFNNKGTVDEYRRPKRAYSVVKELFHEAAVRYWPNTCEKSN